jgi:hypothetical protein
VASQDLANPGLSTLHRRSLWRGGWSSSECRLPEPGLADTATALLVVAGRQLFRGPVPLLAGLLYAIHPLPSLQVATLGTEVLAGFCLSLWVLLFRRALDRPIVGRSALAGDPRHLDHVGRIRASGLYVYRSTRADRGYMGVSAGRIDPQGAYRFLDIKVNASPNSTGSRRRT